MYPLPRRPARGNWIWLASGLLTVTVLTGAAFRYNNARCDQGAQAGAGALAAARLVPAAQPSGAQPGETRPGGAPPTRTPSSAAPSSGVASGVAVYYDPGSAVGGCSLGPFSASGLYVSLPPQRYAGSAACGSYLAVQGPRGRVQAEVVDLCPGCAASMINLSLAAFSRIADPGPGSARVTFWQATNPPLPGPLILRAGATAGGQLTLQVINTGNPLGSVAIGTPAGGPAAWQTLARGSNDYWVSRGRLGEGPFAVRISDDHGHQVSLSQATLTNGSVIRTATWMYRTGPGPATDTSGPAAAGPAATTPRPAGPAAASAPTGAAARPAGPAAHSFAVGC